MYSEVIELRNNLKMNLINPCSLPHAPCLFHLKIKNVSFEHYYE